MFVAEVVFQKADKKITDDAAGHAIYRVLSAWSWSGQILNGSWQFSTNGKRYSAFVLLAEKESLEARFNTPEVARAYDDLLVKGLRQPKVRVIGEDSIDEKMCLCEEKRSSLILYTHQFRHAPPLSCGDCFGYVPLYRLPHVPGIPGWEAEYQACDILQLGGTRQKESKKVERFNLRQMGQLNSALTLRGRKLCRQIQRATKTPTYYSLHIIYESDEHRRCPSCGKDWRLKTPFQRQFDYRCRKCRLLSNTACIFNKTFKT